ncbi:hypothetical protein F2Q69_00024058 [Brassica cretica]|uniref:Uncharacterized protein n=1 Tax=Brassica cretica TaxID=69181 RepID=A0A8S9QG12_BRACR|nr:hypothetical protein F2Q69_00024058 [Brassica cretica]
MLARINGRQLLTVMEKRRGERSGGCSKSRLLGLIACRIYFPLQIYGGALMAAARELLRSFLPLKPSRSKSDEAPPVVLPKETRAGALGVCFALSSSSSHGVLHFTPCRKIRHSKPTRVGSCQPEEWSFGNHMVESQYPGAALAKVRFWIRCSPFGPQVQRWRVTFEAASLEMMHLGVVAA